MQTMTIENLQIKGKPYPAGRLLNSLFRKEELEISWAETLEIIANSNGDPNLLFKIGKLPFIFKMKVNVYVERENKDLNLDIDDSFRVIDLLKKINVNKETVLIVKNNTLVTEDSELKNNDNIKLLSVISGG
mgnify:CR=1 FL=1